LAGNTYYQGGSQWACCATTRAGCGNLAIGCVDGSMIYRATATGTDPLSNSLITRAWYVLSTIISNEGSCLICYSTSIWTASSDASFTRCNTAFMFENDRDSSPKVNIVCGVSSVNWSYYRQAPAIATQSSSAGNYSDDKLKNHLTDPSNSLDFQIHDDCAQPRICHSDQ
jgi:hypothetical protein